MDYIVKCIYLFIGTVVSVEKKELTRYLDQLKFLFNFLNFYSLNFYLPMFTVARVCLKDYYDLINGNFTDVLSKNHKLSLIRHF